MFSKELFEKVKASSASCKLIIVPAQLTLSAEQAVFDALGGDGFFDIQVMSGNKLRAEILKRVGGPGRTMINALGRSMILRKCARELALAGELAVYGKAAGSEGFLSAAGDYIVQAKQNEQSAAAAGGLPGLSEMLKAKLSDMQKLSASYESFMQGKYMDSEDGLAFASEQAEKCEWLKDAELWFCGFYSFTKREQSFIKALEETSLGCHVLFETPEEKFPATLQGVYKAGSENEQISFIAAEILRLIREEGCRAEDIAILSGDIAGDAAAFSRSFEALGIPLYTDEKRSLMHMNAARKLASLLDIAADGYRAQTVCEYMRDSALSSYVKSYHIKPSMFLSPFKYGGKDRIEAETAREKFAAEVAPFIERFKAARGAKKKTAVLYHFLADELKLPAELQSEAVRLADEGYPEAAEENAQGWSVIVAIFDQIAELLGDAELSDAEYRDVVKGAFKDIKLGILPQRSGCVVLGDIYRTKLASVRVLFVSSFGDGKIPRIGGGEGILTDIEAAKLSSLGVTLRKSCEQLAREDRTAVYSAFEAASEKLYLVYAASDAEGNSQKASYLLNLVPSELHRTCSPELFSLEELVSRLRLYKTEGKELDGRWQTVARKMNGSRRYAAAVRGLLYRNDDKKLAEAARKKLLSTEALSPSGLERYAACPYSYFMSRAIRPKEETDFKIDSAAIGNIHHEILCRLSRHLSSDGKRVNDSLSRWMTASDDEIKSFVISAVEEIKEADDTGLYTKGKEEEYRTGRVKEVALRFALNMVRQVRQGNIDAILSEEQFALPFAGVKIHGKIDRIDLSEAGERKLIKIVDYKSGKKSFDKRKIENGLDLQLMLYLEAASQKGETPIGTFFFHIESPIKKTEVDSLDIGSAFDEMKLDGAFVSENRSFIDKRYSDDAGSDIVDKKLEFSAEDFEKLRSAFRDKLCDIISRLSSGDISVRPRAFGSAENDNACRYCPYRAICAFDKELDGCSYS